MNYAKTPYHEKMNEYPHSMMGQVANDGTLCPFAESNSVEVIEQGCSFIDHQLRGGDIQNGFIVGGQLSRGKVSKCSVEIEKDEKKTLGMVL